MTIEARTTLEDIYLAAEDLKRSMTSGGNRELAFDLHADSEELKKSLAILEKFMYQIDDELSAEC